MVLWWIANAVALFVVVPVVILLANRVIRPAIEVERYANDILEHGVGLTKNLEPVPVLLDTLDLVGVAKGHAVRYVTALREIV
jgi:hypothetical protein